MITRTKSSTREWDFEDSNRDCFLVYDHRQTQDYHGSKPVGVDYNNHSHRAFRTKKKQYPTFEEFWETEDYHELRVYGSRYADANKFKLYVESEIERAKQEGYDYEEQVIKKYGVVDSKSDYNTKYELKYEIPPVYLYDWKWWENKDQKIQKQSVNGFVNIMKTMNLNKLVRPAKIEGEEFRVEPFSLEDYEEQL